MAQAGTDSLCTDIRVMIEGSMTMWAIPFAALEGGTTAKKVEKLKGMSREQAHALAAKTGTFVSLEKEQCAVLPPNHYYITANMGNEDAHGLRWQILGNQNTMRLTKRLLEKRAQEVGPTQSPLLQALEKYLDLNVSAAA